MAEARHRAPVSTYRLQLTGEFGFEAAARIAGYLADLGVTHVYLSPILQATPGSTHGYDVTDHSRISAGLGGEDAFRAMVARFREHDLGVIVDIVPNHMAVPVPESLNRQLWSVLGQGQASPYAHWFDVDWAALGNRMLLPILGASPGDCLDELTHDGRVLRYHDHELPVRAGTGHLPLPDLLESQHYQLACWREASIRLNWRRFFDITSLIGIRQEDPDVFAASHEVLIRLVREGLIDGLRVDHPDGLADPRGYFASLAEATGGAWVVAEKILERGEELPAGWRVAGTTGYDALTLVDGLFVDPAGAGPMTAAYQAREYETFAETAQAAKREISTHTFAAEVARLGRLLPGEDPAALRTVFEELLTGFGVYRAYVHPGEPLSQAASTAIDAAARAARTRLPEHLHRTLDTVRAAIAGAGPGELITRFQQTTGPVVAKGTEDTACYRWVRLASLNEVGGDPDHFGVPPAEFHPAASRLAAHWPATQTTLSTHDTKRQEDVRARLAVLAEHTQEWSSMVDDLRERADGGADGGAGNHIDAGTEYLVWQTLTGAWPVGGDRLDQYLTKAVREAKKHTSWTSPDKDYEAAVLAFARNAPVDRIAAFVATLAPDARVNTLGAKLVQLTMPGVADVYQGCELTGYALVDPDNRRPVDYQHRENLLARLTTTRPATLDEEKLLVTTRALHLRREHPGWFAGGYAPLTADGPAAGHVVAFIRGGRAVTVATRLPAGLRRAGGWADTTIVLPDAGWRDVLTGAAYGGSRLPLEELTATLPVALLEPTELEPT